MHMYVFISLLVHTIYQGFFLFYFYFAKHYCSSWKKVEEFQVGEQNFLSYTIIFAFHYIYELI